MFQISTQNKFIHIYYKKAAIFFDETKSFLNIHISGHGHTCIDVNYFQSYRGKINLRQWLPN